MELTQPDDPSATQVDLSGTQPDPSGIQTDPDVTKADIVSDLSDTDADEESVLEVASSQPKANDWTSLNDSQFISFVNKLSADATKLSSEASTSFGFNTLDEEEILAQVRRSPSQQFSQAPIDQGEELEFGDYKTYFHNKQRKQQEQDEEYAEFVSKAKNETRPKIFDGCVIYVNGKTDPDITQLHKLIILYGGKFLAFLGAKGNATHIIAENLTPRKKLEFRNYKVVKPQWITESVDQKKLLPWSDYTLIQNDYGQRQIKFKRVEPDEVVLRDEPEEISQLSEITDPEPEQIAEAPLYAKHMTAKDPKFLETFFAQSRLHHLSTWKMDLRSKFLRKAVEVLKSRTGRSTEQKTVIHVDFDCFFATVSALKHQHDIHTVPLCVTHGSNGSDIASCNYIARSKGCRNGMWLGSARKLCPDLVCLPYEFDDYEKVSQQFYEILMKMPLDSILPVSVDEALLDVTSMVVTKSPTEIMTELRQTVFDQTNCSVSCGCGSNVLLAKLALRKAKPDGIHQVGNVTDFLKDVQFRDLPGIGYSINSKLERKLQQKDITMGQAKAIRKDRLVSLFGIKTGTTIYEYARGIDRTSIDILTDPDKFARKSLSIEVNWGIRFDEDLEVEAFLSRMGQLLNERLAESQTIGSALTLKLAVRHPDAPISPAKFLGMGRCEFVSKMSRLGTETREVGILVTEMKYLWRLLGVDPKELRGVAVTMTKLVNDDKVDTQMRLPVESGKLSVKNSTRSRSAAGQLDLPEEVNWDVFKELPQDIQQEIKQELRRRDLQWTPRKKRRGRNDIAELVSPSRKKRPNQTVTITQQLVDSSAKLYFQGVPITRFSEIISKVGEWMASTSDGPNEADVDLFMDMMLKLIEAGEPLKYLAIVESLERRLTTQPSAQWQEILVQFRTIFKEMDSNVIIFNF